MSPTETPMAASVARFVARLVMGLPSTSSRSARKAPTATRYHPIRRFRRRAGSKGSVMAIASFLSQPLEAHLAVTRGHTEEESAKRGWETPGPKMRRSSRPELDGQVLLDRPSSTVNVEHGLRGLGHPCGEWRSGAREMSPR